VANNDRQDTIWAQLCRTHAEISRMTLYCSALLPNKGKKTKTKRMALMCPAPHRTVLSVMRAKGLQEGREASRQAAHTFTPAVR
jgi:hypothetical protein